MLNLKQSTWWGGPAHKGFTILVFVILASLDNTARGVLPPLYAIIGRDLGVTDAALGLVTASSLLVIAITALAWGYWGDLYDRKPLLLYGTLIWVTGIFLSGLAQSYQQLLLWQIIGAIGIGCISSVGFGVVNDFVPPNRRGLALSLWSLSQGSGAGAGALLGGSLGATNWPLPFFLVASAGVLFAILYLFTFEPKRGQAEPELTKLFEDGQGYQYRIQWSDIRYILSIPTNRWLLTLTFIALLGYGSRVWHARLFIAKVQANGYSLETATIIGNFLALFFEFGFYFVVLGGYLGDRFQKRDLRGRAWLGMGALWLTVPFQMIIFFLPLQDLPFPDEPNFLVLLVPIIWSLFTTPSVTLTFVVALIGILIVAGDLPSRTAIFAEVNLPEHRSTVAGMITITSGISVALGNWLSGLVITNFASSLPEPTTYATGLALFHLFFIPAGYCYYRISRTVSQDITQMRTILRQRAELPQP